MKTKLLFLFLFLACSLQAQKYYTAGQQKVKYSLKGKYTALAEMLIVYGPTDAINEARKANRTGYNQTFGKYQWFAQDSWKNKWNFFPESNIIRRERFPGSSTIFAGVTDFAHASELIKYTTLSIATVDCDWINHKRNTPKWHYYVDRVILFAARSLTFNIIYQSFKQ